MVTAEILAEPRPKAAREAGARPRLTYGLLGVMPIAAIVIQLLGMAAGVRGADASMLALALLTAILASLPLVLDQAREPSKRHVLLSMFAMVFMTYLVVPVFTNYLPGDEPKVPPGMAWAVLSPMDVVRGQSVALVGLVALLVGYALPLGKQAGEAVPALRRQWSAGETVFVAIGFAMMGWVVFLLGQFGLIPAELGTGVAGALAAGYISAIGLLTLAWLGHGSRLALSLVVVLVPLTMAFNFFTGSKKAFLGAAAMVVLASMLHRGRIRARWILLAVLATALIYPTNQFYRDVILQGLTLKSVDVLARPGRTIGRISDFLGTWDTSNYLGEGFEAVGNRLDGLGRASLIIRETPRSVPFQGGWTLGHIFIAYIPRILWPGKPIISIGQWVTDTYGSGPKIRSSTGPTWIGEFYLNFGVWGVFAGMFAFGFLLRVAHQVLLVRSRTIPAFFLSILILYGLATTVGGGVVGAINRVIFAMGPLLAFHALLLLLGGTRRSLVEPRALEPALLEQGRGK